MCLYKNYVSIINVDRANSWLYNIVEDSQKKSLRDNSTAYVIMFYETKEEKPGVSKPRTQLYVADHSTQTAKQRIVSIRAFTIYRTSSKNKIYPDEHGFPRSGTTI